MSVFPPDPHRSGTLGASFADEDEHVISRDRDGGSRARADGVTIPRPCRRQGNGTATQAYVYDVLLTQVATDACEKAWERRGTWMRKVPMA